MKSVIITGICFVAVQIYTLAVVWYAYKKFVDEDEDITNTEN